MGKFYAVRVGHTPGVYDDWARAKAQVDNYPGAEHKSFKTKAAAEVWMQSSTSQPDKAIEAQKLLAACKWTVRQLAASDGTKVVYEVYDQNEVLLRVFVPPSRLLDYARGVFDAQGYHNE